MMLASADRLNARLLINGVHVFGVMRATVINTNCFSADTFSITLATALAPFGSAIKWADTVPIFIELSIISQRSKDGWCKPIITGFVDTVHLDPVCGVVVLEGRDLSSRLIDSYRQQDFVNQRASEIVSSIAMSHGLTPIITQTNDIVGRYYSDGYTKLSLGLFSRVQSDWDLVVYLARLNKFDAFVCGSELFFQPSGQSGFLPTLLPTRLLTKVRLERNLNLPSSVPQVQSWNSQAVLASRSNPDQAADGAGLISPFLFGATNSSLQQVTNLARQYETELSRLNIVLHLETSWDETLSPRMSIALDGALSLPTMVYQIDTIERHYSSSAGSTQVIRAIPFPNV